MSHVHLFGNVGRWEVDDHFGCFLLLILVLVSDHAENIWRQNAFQEKISNLSGDECRWNCDVDKTRSREFNLENDTSTPHVNRGWYETYFAEDFMLRQILDNGFRDFRRSDLLASSTHFLQQENEQPLSLSQTATYRRNRHGWITLVITLFSRNDHYRVSRIFWKRCSDCLLEQADQRIERAIRMFSITLSAGEKVSFGWLSYGRGLLIGVLLGIAVGGFALRLFLFIFHLTGFLLSWLRLCLWLGLRRCLWLHCGWLFLQFLNTLKLKIDVINAYSSAVVDLLE